MGVYKRGDSRYYHFDFQLRGKRYCGSTGRTEARAAEAFEKSVRRDVDCQARFVPTSRLGISLATALEKFIALHLDGLPGQPKVARDRVTHITRIVTVIGMNRPVSYISAETLLLFIKKRKNSNHAIKPATINFDLRAIRNFMKFCTSILGLSVHAIEWKDLKQEVEEFPIRIISIEEEARISAVQDATDRAIREMAIGTSMRISNITEMRWDQVSIPELTVTVRQKAGRIHVAALTPHLAELIEQQRGRHATRVFAYHVTRERQYIPAYGRFYDKGEYVPVTTSAHYKRWRQCLEDAEIAPARRHDMRHTAATRMYRATGDIAVVQKALGHRNIQQTIKYTHLFPDDVRAAMLKVEGATQQNDR